MGAGRFLVLCALPLLMAAGQAVTVPSGQPVSLLEVLWPKPDAAKGDRVARFRFIAPKLKKGADADTDLDALCEKVALPMVRKKGVTLDQIVVSMSAARMKLGESRPDVAQVIEAYLPKGGACELAEPW